MLQKNGRGLYTTLFVDALRGSAANTAMESKGCKLTVLGKHYRRLAEKREYNFCEFILILNKDR